MTVSLMLFFVAVAIVLVVEYYINRRILNIPTVLSIPYLLIIPFNNLLMKRFGFFCISDAVIEMISTGLLSVLFGSVLIDFRRRVSKTGVTNGSKNNKYKINYYNEKNMLRYSFFIELVVMVRLLYVIKSHGTAYLATSDFEGYLIRGITGHLFLTIYPLLPILFYFWLNKKTQYKYLIVYGIGITLLFFTFVKYHVIGVIVLTYLFVSFEEKAYIKKGALLLVLVVAAIFICNYVLGFALFGTISKVNRYYYFRHLWAYIGGSLIYDNYIFSKGVRVGVSFSYKIGSFVLAPINLFINAIFGFRITPHIDQAFLVIASNGERSNVVDAIGYLFPSFGSVFDIAEFYLILVIVGMIFTVFYNREIKKTKRFSMPLCVFMTFFVFFSFFGTFFVNLTPWEILFYSYIMIPIFDTRNHFSFKKIIIKK